jgi:hypothetical protein
MFSIAQDGQAKASETNVEGKKSFSATLTRFAGSFMGIFKIKMLGCFAVGFLGSLRVLQAVWQITLLAVLQTFTLPTLKGVWMSILRAVLQAVS